MANKIRYQGLGAWTGHNCRERSLPEYYLISVGQSAGSALLTLNRNSGKVEQGCFTKGVLNP